MNNTQDGNPPSNLLTRYTKDLHLAHVAAFWEGKLEFKSPQDGWVKAKLPPCVSSCLDDYRIIAPKQLRPWNTTEIPLGAWIQEKGSNDRSIIVAALDGRAVRVEWDEHCAITPEYLLSHFEHSTDNGKTWLPCGILE